MKKLLLSLVACLVAFVSVHAEEATLSFADKANRTTFTTSKQVWEQNGIIVTNNKSSSTSNVADYAKPARFYKSSELIVECTLGNISSIVYDCNSPSYATALKSSITGSTVSVSSDKVTVTLDGSSNSFRIASLTGGQVRVDELTVTYVVTGDSEKPMTPTFSVAAGTYYEAQSVEISCATEDAAIYYTIDGTEPDATSIAYTGAIAVAETTTIKAVAIKDGEASNVATATYVIDAVTELETVEAFYALGTASTGKGIAFVNPLTVVYQQYNNLIVKDETGSMLIYGSSNKYINGDVIAGVKGTVGVYGGNMQVVPVEMPAATQGTPVEPKEVSVEELNECAYLDYVKVEDVTVVAGTKERNYTLSDGTTSYAAYNQFSIEMPTLVAGNIYDVTGFVSSYNGTAQLQPTEVVLDEIATGIEEVNAANAPVEYYNLQGVKVANPENGIFIKKQGAKATKVVM